MSRKAEISLEVIAAVKAAMATDLEAEMVDSDTHQMKTQDSSQELVIVAPGPKPNQLATMMRN